ncbi:MAG: PRC-barrel domain-containing protein [Planctomycetes bacterium]|nr:PRC-barrel domain-containing protein [Planctomycetota bacterium]
MGKRKVFLWGLFAVGLVAVLCAYGLATEQSANKNQGAANQNQGVASQQGQATAQPGAAPRQAPPGQTAQAMTLVRTSELIGKEVKSTQGESLGRIHDIVLAPDYQSVSYVALSYGGVFGVNSRLYAIPWQALHVGPQGNVTMSATKDQFTQAPGFTNRNWPSQAETRWLGAGAGTPGAAATAPSAGSSSAAGSAAASSSTPRSATANQAAGQSRTGQSAAAPGQSSATAGQSQTAQSPSSSAAAGQMAAGSQDVQMRRVTHLTGTEVRNTENQDLGDIEGFAINIPDGHVVYDILSFGGIAGVGEKYAAVPANAVRIQAQNHTATLNATKQTLDSVAFSPSEFPNLSSPEYMSRLSKIFPAAPAGGALGYVPSQQPQMQYIANEKAWSGEGMHGKAFNPSTVKTITGTVESVGSFKPEGAAAGATGGLRLRVKTTSGQTVIVYAGPVSFAEQKNFFVMPGDQITITGSETKIRFRSIILASELKKDGQTLELRDKSGKPLWAMGGMGGMGGQRSPGAATSQTRQE